MIIVLKQNAQEKNIEQITKELESLGLAAHVSRGETTTIIGVIGDKTKLTGKNLDLMPGVEKIVAITESYKLANKQFHTSATVVKIGDVEIGGDKLVVMAGPCAVESRLQLLETAQAVKKGGASILRGGVYKPRTSPYSFQGLEEEGLKYMREARNQTGLKIVCEVTSAHAIELCAQYVDILQIGARNMQNFELLKFAGKSGLPILLKRGLSATIDEWLNAAEYILSEGNPNVILCERGIRTYETATRNTLDLSAVPVIKAKSHLPVIVDPSHACGVRAYVPALSKAAVACGCDGLILEVHPHPEAALSDGAQSLNPEDFEKLMGELKPLAKIMGRLMA
ncbi:MAG: 3-deoxy-7-phosphoheptulonate synthase [Clostridiales bacterium]|jgi:3-deoxy-7-phosphoheptulonate synthase|nr:3-deoxy-7-phosphoheptulonate synthase [Clostridiales bacterium]